MNQKSANVPAEHLAIDSVFEIEVDPGTAVGSRVLFPRFGKTGPARP